MLARTLAEAAFAGGLDVIQSEIHGLAQRGGAVVAHVRFGSRVYSPLVDPYGADLMIALEALEALRNRGYAGKETKVICNKVVLPPPSAAAARADVPSLEEIRTAFSHVKLFRYIEAKKLAEREGLPQGANIVILGFSFGLGLIPLDEESIVKGIRAVVSERYLEKNLKLFDVGRKAAKEGE